MSQAPSATRPHRGEELDVSVESLAHGGAGVARRDGYVVFVQGAVPGDVVRAGVASDDGVGLRHELFGCRMVAHRPARRRT